MRLIDADALYKLHASAYGGEDLVEFCKGWNSCIEYLTQYTTAIDAPPVVRCKDCIYRGQHDLCPMCVRVYLLDVAEYMDCTEDDGFCHRGLKLKRGAEG